MTHVFNHEDACFILRALEGYLSEWVGAMPDADAVKCEELIARLKRDTSK